MIVVKRYTVEQPQMLLHLEGHSLGTVERVVVYASDFDRAIAERDALQLRLNVADQRIDELERALGSMLFAFDDGVGREWSADLLDFARKQATAVEFNPEAGERYHGIPGTSFQRLNMLANQGE